MLLAQTVVWTPLAANTTQRLLFTLAELSFRKQHLCFLMTHR